MTGQSPTLRMRSVAAIAMIGTDRSGDSPSKLLHAVAALSTHARAGFMPRRLEGRLPSCPIDPRPSAGAPAMATLARLLANPDAGLIEEWCRLAHRSGVRVADAAVPLLLDWWSRQPRRAPEVFHVLGERGAWLASLNAEWRKPVAGSQVPADADKAWQTGTTAERAALLLTLRRLDPARSLSLLRSTWHSDGAEERRRFLEVLAEHRSIDDEPFLEEALDDKSKAVRRQAAAVLALIPASRLRQRMNQRARDIIVVEIKKGLLRRTVNVSLRPPSEFDKAWERDGIEEQAAGGVGKRAWWMRQILAAADLATWTQLTTLEPQGLLDSIRKDDHFADAFEALMQRAGADADESWCQVLTANLLQRDTFETHALQSLLAGLPPARREPLLLEAVGHKRFSPAERWEILTRSGEPWSADFSLRALALLGKHRPKGDAEAWPLSDCVDRASRLVAPSAAEEFNQTVSAMFAKGPPESFSKSIDRARLRAEMHKEFAA